MIPNSKWFESIYPIVLPFLDRAVTTLNEQSSLPLALRELMKMPGEVITACREANIEVDDAELCEAFASALFERLCG